MIPQEISKMTKSRRWEEFCQGIVNSKTWQPFFTFFLIAGLGLFLSIPMAAKVRGLGSLGYLSNAPVFFSFYLLASGIFGANIGGISAVREEGWKESLKLNAARIFLVGFFSLPFVLYERAMSPGDGARMSLVLLYAYLVAFLWATVSGGLERSSRLGSSGAFILKYALLIFYFVTPAGLISPLAGSTILLQAKGPRLIFLVLSVPAGLLSFFLIIGSWRNFRE